MSEDKYVNGIKMISPKDFDESYAKENLRLEKDIFKSFKDFLKSLEPKKSDTHIACDVPEEFFRWSLDVILHPNMKLIDDTIVEITENFEPRDAYSVEDAEFRLKSALVRARNLITTGIRALNGRWALEINESQRSAVIDFAHAKINQQIVSRITPMLRK